MSSKGAGATAAHWTNEGGAGRTWRTACGLVGAAARAGYLAPDRATCPTCRRLAGFNSSMPTAYTRPAA